MSSARLSRVGTAKVMNTGIPAVVSSGNVHVGDAVSVQDSVTSSLQAQNVMKTVV